MWGPQTKQENQPENPSLDEAPGKLDSKVSRAWSSSSAAFTVAEESAGLLLPQLNSNFRTAWGLRNQGALHVPTKCTLRSPEGHTHLTSHHTFINLCNAHSVHNYKGDNRGWCFSAYRSHDCSMFLRRRWGFLPLR